MPYGQCSINSVGTVMRAHAHTQSMSANQKDANNHPQHVSCKRYASIKGKSGHIINMKDTVMLSIARE